MGWKLLADVGECVDRPMGKGELLAPDHDEMGEEIAEEIFAGVFWGEEGKKFVEPLIGDLDLAGLPLDQSCKGIEPGLEVLESRFGGAVHVILLFGQERIAEGFANGM